MKRCGNSKVLYCRKRNTNQSELPRIRVGVGDRDFIIVAPSRHGVGKTDRLLGCFADEASKFTGNDY